MRLIELDGESWVSELEVIEALLVRLEAPEWHGHSMAALVDSIATGAINRVEPPYEIRIHGARSMSKDVRLFLEDLAQNVEEAIAYPSRHGGHRKIRFVFRSEPRSR